LKRAHGLHLMPGWDYTGRKEATRDDLVSVPALQPFQPWGALHRRAASRSVTLRLYADNIADKRYWKDTGASYGDTFIHLVPHDSATLGALHFLSLYFLAFPRMKAILQ